MANDATPSTPTDEKKGKGTPTPTRAEQEAARKRPLVPTDRKTAGRESRSKMAEERAKARVGMANGEEKYLTARDRGPQRRYVRNYVDARLNIGELMLPLLLVVIALGLVNNVTVQFISYIALWVYLIAVIFDSFLLGFVVKRRIEAKWGKGSMQKGTRWYAAMRAIQFRMIRLPKPQVKRFHFTED